MLYLVEPNIKPADELVPGALRRQFGEGATFEDRSGAPGIPLAELVKNDGAHYTPTPGADHLGKVPRRLMRLVYELAVYSEHERRPSDLPPKCVWVVFAAMHANLVNLALPTARALAHGVRSS